MFKCSQWNYVLKLSSGSCFISTKNSWLDFKCSRRGWEQYQKFHQQKRINHFDFFLYFSPSRLICLGRTWKLNWQTIDETHIYIEPINLRWILWNNLWTNHSNSDKPQFDTALEKFTGSQNKYLLDWNRPRRLFLHTRELTTQSKYQNQFDCTTFIQRRQINSSTKQK